MKRRDFLKMAGLMGMGAMFPLVPSLRLEAAQDGYTGPLWLTVDARGGWDPTSFCDPKGYAPGGETDPTRLNNYPAANIMQIGNFSVAPPPDSFSGDTTLYTAAQFFQSHFNELLLINGIDSQTNAHSDGARHNWSGELARNGFPNFGALVAGLLTNNRALPFLTNGGYANSGGLLTPARVDNAGLAAIYEIAYPNRSQNAKNATSRNYYAQDVLDLINTANSARLQNVRASQHLPRISSAMEKLSTTRETAGQLTAFAETLTNNPEKPLSFFNNRNNAQNLYRQGRIALSAYTAGVTSAAHISAGGFDTHSNHDQNHYPRLMDLLQGIDAILQEAQERGLRDNIVVVVGSDFGRTNKYNAGLGKDHWPITSMMFMGNSKQIISGNRVIGATTSEHKAQNIDPQTLQVSTSAQAVKITPAYIHRALRKLAGVDSAAVAAGFDLTGSDINFFS